MTRRSTARQSGQVLITVAISMVVLIGAIGIAIDSGLGYMVKAKLNAAVDAASIAAARAVAQGDDQATQSANARQAARTFFNANYPAGYLGTTSVFDEPTIVFDRGKVTVDTSAQAALPTTFMRVLGFTNLNVGAASQTVRKDLDLALVMDTSGSLKPVASSVRSAGKLFVGKFNPTTDRLGLIHFSNGAKVDVPIERVSRGFNRGVMNNNINNLQFSGWTNSSEGFWNARQELNAIKPVNRSSLRVIVFFSDGVPNTFASRFKFKSTYSCSTPGSLASEDQQNGVMLFGLWDIGQQESSLWGGCKANDWENMADRLASDGLPKWYNAHGANDKEFQIEVNQPRKVTRNPTWANVQNASRNLVEAMAKKARQEGIYVFTLGLGPDMVQKKGPGSGERGEDLLKCMANTPDAPSRCYKPDEPVGVYCYAATEQELTPCFSRLASEILRITR